MTQEATIYLDMDGVMADFDGHFPEVFGVDHRDGMSKSEMWKHIHSIPDFFLTMQPMEGALRFYNRIAAAKPILLTACPIVRGHEEFIRVARQKRAWKDKWLGKDVRMIPSAGSDTKPMYMHQPGDILIDDYRKNTEAWEEAGGRAILHRGDFAATHETLSKYLKEVSYVSRKSLAAHG